MCSIIAGFDKRAIEDLVELNQFRGNFSYSCTEVDLKNRPVSQIKAFGAFNKDAILEDNYKIAHVQAPTGGMVKDSERIHPVVSGKNMLWHNGIITPKGVRFLQDLLGTDETFDTKLLLDAIEQEGFSILSEIEGLFSCVMLYNTHLMMFRTKHGKLFLDEQLNISSERFENSKCINADTVYVVDTDNLEIVPLYFFKTKRFNFVVKGELEA